MERIRILAFIFGIFMLNNSIEASSFDGIKDRRPIMSAKSFKRKEPEVSFNFLAAVQTRLDFPTFAATFMNRMRIPLKSFNIKQVLGCSVLAACPFIFFACGDNVNSGVRSGLTLYTTASICMDYWVSKHITKSSLLECDSRSALKLHQLCSNNGGLYIKAAQYFASLDHVLPAAYIKTLSTLNDQGPVTPIESIREIIREDFGAPLECIYSEFNASPIGSASIGQVHFARLRSTGEAVAVKIQHPNIESDAELDLVTFKYALKLVNLFFPLMGLEWLVDEFKECLQHEVNFLTEASNSVMARKSFDKNSKLRSKVKIPSIHAKFSSNRVITMELCFGTKITDVAGLKEASIDANEMTNLITEIFLEMIFKHNYFHCDPHPGNLLVNFDGKTRQIQVTILDHGLYKTIAPRVVSSFSRFLMAILNNNSASHDHKEIAAIARELNVPVDFLLDLKSLINELIAARLAGQKVLGISEKVKTFLKNQSPETLKQLPREFIYLLKVLDLLRSNQRNTYVPPASGLPRPLILLMNYCLEAIDNEGKDFKENRNSDFYKNLRVYWKIIIGIMRNSK